jgi:U3 small nucleolar RNA-associated protein 25
MIGQVSVVWCRLGIRITRGQIKLFADPMQSDIIIASPVGLATKLAEDAAAAAAAAGGSDGRGGKQGGGKGAAAGSSSGSSSGAADFLSSIEICVIERADVMLMQNWQHVVTGARWSHTAGCRCLSTPVWTHP